MLPSASRLRGGTAIREVSRRGARVTRSGLNVSVLLAALPAGADPVPPSRATVVVGKRAGGAVTRNRLRRRVRHALVGCWDLVPSGSALVLRAGPEASLLDPPALDRALRSALRAGVERAGTASGRVS